MLTRQYRLSSRPRHRMFIAVLDDHPVVALGTATYLRTQSDFIVNVVETSGDRLTAGMQQQACDAAVLDFCLPQATADGVHFLRRMRRLFPALITVTFSAGNPDEIEYAAFRAGANGFVPKAAPIELLGDVIRLAAGQPNAFFAIRGDNVVELHPRRPEVQLTAAEAEVLRHIASGLSVTQISQRLCRSKQTISTHKRKAMDKLDLADDLALAVFLQERFELG